MSHCNPTLGDQENMVIPTGTITVLSSDLAPYGSGNSLGASSNGNTIAVSFKNSDPGLVVYDSNGNRMWDSGTLFDSTALFSAPLVGTDGKVIMADDKHLGLFNPDGSIFAWTATPGGTPISPILTQNGAIVLATKNGPVSIYSLATGALLGYQYLQDPGATNYYQTFNTPCTVGNRIYVSSSLTNDPTNTGRLYALDINPANPNPISVAWYYTFGGPSGASPLCAPANGFNTVVFFDGDHAAPGNIGGPTIYAVGDAGTSGVLQWSAAVTTGKVQANMPYDSDPVNGPCLWYFTPGYPGLFKLQLSSGKQVATIKTNALIPPPKGSRTAPSSAMSMATDPAGNPVMLIAFNTAPIGSGASYVAAINTLQQTLEWTVVVSSNNSNQVRGQFPIVVDSSGTTRVAFATFSSGLMTVGP